jgi:hypothetical protein
MGSAMKGDGALPHAKPGESAAPRTLAFLAQDHACARASCSKAARVLDSSEDVTANHPGTGEAV